jgi:GNAT superfamily N-acetyltransferase
MSEESTTPMWRAAGPSDDDAITSMCLSLYREDPGFSNVDDAGVRRTLAAFRAEPHRGRAAVADFEGFARAYAFLVPFWSNELGGAVCQVDELFVEEGFRSRGIGRSLFDAIATVYPDERFVAIALGVTPGNQRARALYERVGFRAVGTTLVRISPR